MVYQKLYRIVVIREYRREILALLIDENNGALAALMDHLLDAVCKTRRLQSVRHNGNRVKLFKRNKREDRRLAGFTSEIILVFQIACENQDISIVLESIVNKALNKPGLIVFISLRYK